MENACSRYILNTGRAMGHQVNNLLENSSERFSCACYPQLSCKFVIVPNAKIRKGKVTVWEDTCNTYSQ